MGRLEEAWSVLALLLCLLVESTTVPQPDNLSKAIVTYATNDVYAISAVVLGRSIDAFGRGNNTELIVLVHAAVSKPARRLLTDAGWKVKEVEPIQPPHPNSEVESIVPKRDDRDLSVEYGKLHAWRLRSSRDEEPFARVLLLDSDQIVKHPLDDLLSERFYRGNLTGRPEMSSKKGIFNGGILAFRADPDFPDALLADVHSRSHSGMALQGLLNERLKAEWQTKTEEERMPQWVLYGAAACSLPGNTLATVTSDIANATILDFQGQSKPWRWPEQIRPDLSQCEVVTAYAKLWAAILAMPFAAQPRTVRSLITHIDEQPRMADAILQLATEQATAALGAGGRGDEQQSKRERQRVRVVAKYLQWDVGKKLREAARKAEALAKTHAEL